MNRQDASVSIGPFKLQNPVICGSGESVMTPNAIAAALATGVAGVIAKSINENPLAAKQLDHADYVALNSAFESVPWFEASPRETSVLCRSGLAQVDAASWLAELGRLDERARQDHQFVAASVAFGALDGCLRIVEMAQRAKLRVFELNIGAAHGEEVAYGAITVTQESERVHAIVDAVRQSTDMQVWVKLTGLNADLPRLAETVRDAGGNAVVLASRFMALLPDPETMLPVLGTAGAYGGRWALPITCRRLAQVRQRTGASVSLIGTNGARSGLDAIRMLLAGASAVELTSLTANGFQLLGEAVAEVQAYLDRKTTPARAIVGRAADASTTYTQQPAIPGNWRKYAPVSS